ncbi:DUF1499 domain-containing protein [Aquidulcibacter sp.]|uniref:DUF1499 domain-containing protein n=1 Tax=Aquidulcibacter sp. TaxID=2052990 RepID=UPI0025C6E0A7|nr:DUF1499 domain-containing protein [Aquidulcibacter sp.]MCA3695699.1 DUF1499 domain-containing protein [Aquidulcibacter sp.]
MIKDFPLDFARFKKIWKPNQCLALPGGFQASEAPDLLSGVFKASVTEVREAWLEIARSQSRVSDIREEEGQIEAVQRTALVGFPDWITAMPVDLGEGKASICVFSRSKYGIRDMGVNEKRVRLWLSLLAHKLPAAG